MYIYIYGVTIKILVTNIIIYAHYTTNLHKIYMIKVHIHNFASQTTGIHVWLHVNVYS